LMFKQFIFRWKLTQVEVWPSVRNTEAEVWEYAERWLVEGGKVDDKKAVEHVRTVGEVVPYDT
jgi:hypothetical protein